MLKKLDVRDDAPWKQRFRAASIAWARVAKNNPARGVACTNRGGVQQLYAWDVPTGTLTQVTDQPAGVLFGMIYADGEFICYHKDEGGSEIGHYVRVPFGGGQEEDITPDMPPYASQFVTQSRWGNLIGFTTARPTICVSFSRTVRRLFTATCAPTTSCWTKTERSARCSIGAS